MVDSLTEDKIVLFMSEPVEENTLKYNLCLTYVADIISNRVKHSHQPKTCSAKKCDNLLVEADIFYHFRGLILCNAKHIQFIRYKKRS